MPTRTKTALLLAVLCGLSARSVAEEPQQSSEAPGVVRIGAVAYAPSTVTVFRGLKQYLNKNGFASDYVLYSNYDALVAALDRGEVDIAWNTPLAHAQYHVQNNCASQTLVMRDVDVNIRSVLVVRGDSGIKSLEQLTGKRLVLGSSQSAEATVAPVHFLKKQGVDFGKLQIVSLEKEVDSQGNPCASPQHVLQALRDGRGDAGIITARLWKRIQSQPSDSALKVVWTSPPFSHCVFTASAEFDKQQAARFTQLMTAMDASDPQTRDVLRLEGAKKWLAGSPDGFQCLVEALQAQQGEGSRRRPQE